MVTKAIIKRLNTSEDNHFLVYIPLLRKANDKEENAILEATLVSIRGIENTLKVNDIVYVAFEENQFDRPVIIGKLYLGKEDRENVNTSISAQSLYISNDSVLENSVNAAGLDLSEMDINIRKLMEQLYLSSNSVSYDNTKVLETESGDEQDVTPLQSSVLQNALDEIVIRLSDIENIIKNS